MRQRLSVGIGDDEIHPFQLGLDPGVDGVAAGAADSEYGNSWFHLGCLNVAWYGNVDGHVTLRLEIDSRIVPVDLTGRHEGDGETRASNARGWKKRLLKIFT
jgi:hypothetical protein